MIWRFDHLMDAIELIDSDDDERDIVVLPLVRKKGRRLEKRRPAPRRQCFDLTADDDIASPGHQSHAAGSGSFGNEAASRLSSTQHQSQESRQRSQPSIRPPIPNDVVDDDDDDDDDFMTSLLTEFFDTLGYELLAMSRKELRRAAEDALGVDLSDSQGIVEKLGLQRARALQARDEESSSSQGAPSARAGGEQSGRRPGGDSRGDSAAPRPKAPPPARPPPRRAEATARPLDLGLPHRGGSFSAALFQSTGARGRGGFMVVGASGRPRGRGGPGRSVTGGRGPQRRPLPCFDFQRGDCGRGDGCSYSHDDAASGVVARAPPRGEGEGPSDETSDSGGGSENPLCQHGEPSVARRVTKAGPNCGRAFFGCPYFRDDPCKFFEFSDDRPPLPEAATKAPPRPKRRRVNYFAEGDCDVDVDVAAVAGGEGIGVLLWEGAGTATFG